MRTGIGCVAMFFLVGLLLVRDEAKAEGAPACVLWLGALHIRPTDVKKPRTVRNEAFFGRANPAEQKDTTKLLKVQGLVQSPHHSLPPKRNI